MTMTEIDPQVQQPEYFDDYIGQESVSSPAQISVESRLAADDPIQQRLHAVGMQGEPIMKFVAGKQVFAVVDISGVPRDEVTGYYLPFSEGYSPVAKSPDKFEPVEDGEPVLALVHFEGDSIATRAVRSFAPIAIGRNVKHKDPKADRFNYAGDPYLSGDHADLVYDPTIRTLHLRSNSKTNRIGLRYELLSFDQAEERRAKKAAVSAGLGGHAVAASFEHYAADHEGRYGRDQGVIFGDRIERDILRMQPKERLAEPEVNYLEEVVGSGSQAVQGLLEQHGMQLPTSGEGRLGVRRLITAAKHILDLNEGHHSAASLTQVYERAQVTPQDLIPLLDKMATQRFNVSKAVRPHQRSVYEDYARQLGILIKDLAQVNEGLPVTPHIETKFQAILAAQIDAEFVN